MYACQVFLKRLKTRAGYRVLLVPFRHRPNCLDTTEYRKTSCRSVPNFDISNFNFQSHQRKWGNKPTARTVRCVWLDAMRCRLISVWHPRERLESIQSSLLSISCSFVYYTRSKVCSHVTLGLSSVSAVSLNEDIHEQHLQNCSESQFISILPF